MKQIEKLALESIPDNWNGHCNCEEDFKEGFQAGFRKARKMLLTALPPSIPTGHAFYATPWLLKAMQELGEEEV